MHSPNMKFENQPQASPAIGLVKTNAAAVKATNKRVAKFDEVQIKNGALEDLGKRILAQSKLVREYEEAAREKAGVEIKKAENHRDSIAALITEAKSKCTGMAFKVFREKYVPDLGRARIYQLLQIGTGKKTEADVQAQTRARVAKSRAAKKTAQASDTKPVSDTNDTEPPPTPASAALPRQRAEQAIEDIETAAMAALDISPVVPTPAALPAPTSSPPTPEAKPKPASSNAIILGGLAIAWRDVEATAGAGNKTRFKASLRSLVQAANRVLADRKFWK